MWKPGSAVVRAVRFTVTVPAQVYCCLRITRRRKKKIATVWSRRLSWPTRPRELEADVVKFQNNREKWIAFVGLLNGRPYEIFTGLADDDEGIMLPKNVSKGSIIKSYDEDGQ